MKVNTRLFGEIEIDEDKIITLDKGIVGFPDLKRFTIIYDSDSDEEKKHSMMWFQSLDEPQFAMPVVAPNDIVPDYNPTINDELLEPLGNLNEENLYVLVTMKVPKQIEDMTINLKAPIIMNSDTLKGGQIIVEDDVDVQYPIYDILKKAKDEAGE